MKLIILLLGLATVALAAPQFPVSRYHPDNKSSNSASSEGYANTAAKDPSEAELDTESTNEDEQDHEGAEVESESENECDDEAEEESESDFHSVNVDRQSSGSIHSSPSHSNFGSSPSVNYQGQSGYPSSPSYSSGDDSSSDSTRFVDSSSHLVAVPASPQYVQAPLFHATNPQSSVPSYDSSAPVSFGNDAVNTANDDSSDSVYENTHSFGHGSSSSAVSPSFSTFHHESSPSVSAPSSGSGIFGHSSGFAPSSYYDVNENSATTTEIDLESTTVTELTTLEAESGTEATSFTTNESIDTFGNTRYSGRPAYFERQ